MKRLGSFLALLGMSVAAMGAKGGGCSAEYAPGDGSSSEWGTGPVPEPSAQIQPMSCAWLDTDNCWKALVASADDCRAAVSDAGSFNEDRDACTYPDGARWELGGPLGTPAAGSTQYPITNWRILDGEGDACMTGKILGVGRTLIDFDGSVALFESPTVTTFHLTCPDGTTYGNDQPGTCEDFGERYLGNETPGVLFTCDGTEEVCRLSLWGAESGAEVVTSCEF
jgi:hypothetical protein